MRALRTATLLVALALPASAHDGPPYPLLVDWQIEELTVSIWADPDVGVGTYYIYVEQDGAPALPDDFELRLEAHPIEDLALVRESLAVVPRDGEPFQLVAELPYDFRGIWTTRFHWTLGERSGERALDVDVTPPGLGPFDILWYLFPFLGIGFLWAKALLRRRAALGAPHGEAAKPSSPAPREPEPN